MPEIKIKVRDKCAEGEGVIICNNSDYTVVWDLDSEWEPYSTRTMRVNLADGTYQDAVFTGNSAPLPVLTASGWVSVGLYAGDLHTSRAARLLALSSVLTPVGSPAAPAEDVYAQIMAKLNELSTVSPEDVAKAVEGYLAEHPIEETDPTVPEWAKAGITGATVGQIAKIAAVDASGVPTAWSPADMASGGGGETWEEIAEIELRTDTAEYVLADFATWRKVKVTMTRPQYIGGLNKNVWCKVGGQDDTYSCGYMTLGYGYSFWQFSAEVNELFISSSHIETNNRNSAEYVRSTGTFMPLASPVETYKFKLRFVDTSVIQAGDKVTVIGVRR